MIDDVAYLKDNALEDSQIIYIDSTTRDRRVFQDPAEYVIEFDQPFRHVYGFDILDASLPATAYNVESYASTLYYTVVNRKPNSLLLVSPTESLQEIRRCGSFVSSFENYVNDVFLLVSESSPALVALLAADTTQTSLLTDDQRKASHPNQIYVREVVAISSGTRVRQYTIQSPASHYIFEYDNVRYAIDIADPLVPRLSLNEFSLIFDDETAGGGPVVGPTTPRIPRTVTGIVFFTRNFVTSGTYSAARAAGLYEFEITHRLRSLEPGQYDVLTLINDLNDLLNPTSIEVESTTPIPRKQGKLVFSSPNFFLFNADRGDLVKAVGFNVYPFTASSEGRHLPIMVGANDFVYGAIEQGGRYRAFCPGLVSLLGERFLILRIPEIETHLYGSFAYNRFTPGLGMFKNAASFGAITNLRFDFVTAPKKPFHPIGKLSRITIRFETADGRLYDFKGVNHQIMASIKFYVPYRSKMQFAGSVLNPEYDPDVRTYMTTKKTIEQREDSDDEEYLAEDVDRAADYNRKMEALMREIELDELEDADEDEYEEDEDEYEDDHADIEAN